MKSTAILLAGSRPGRDEFAAEFGVDLKALIPVANAPMIVRPLRALVESNAVSSIIVVSQEPSRLAEVLPKSDRIAFREARSTIAETLLDICNDPRVAWPLLVTTADHALLDAATVDEFLSAASGRDIAIGVVERENLMRRLPETRRTWLKFRGGAYTGANLFALKSPAVRPAIETWRSVEQDRKKAWRIISLLGPSVLLLAAVRLISLDEILRQLSGRLALNIGAVRLSNPLAGVDVDKPDDHRLVEAIIQGKI